MLQYCQCFRRVLGQLSLGVAGLLMGLGVWCFSWDAAIALAPSQQPIGTVAVHLGTAAGELKFQPDQLVFTAGQRYKLVMDNPSDQKHYFTAKDFADVIWSQKVEAAGVEVKGAIHEIELKPGAIAEWIFVPQKPGTYELHCSIPGHAEAGMMGTITVLEPA